MLGIYCRFCHNEMLPIADYDRVYYFCATCGTARYTGEDDDGKWVEWFDEDGKDTIFTPAEDAADQQHIKEIVEG